MLEVAKAAFRPKVGARALVQIVRKLLAAKKNWTLLLILPQPAAETAASAAARQAL
jgi:hypothetical protein